MDNSNRIPFDYQKNLLVLVIFQRLFVQTVQSQMSVRV